MAKSADYMARYRAQNRATLSQEEKQRTTKGIQTHSSAENDSAQRGIENYIAREQKIVDSYDNYKRIGKIKSRDDPWFKGHLDSLNSLKAKLAYFKKERKRRGTFCNRAIAC